jgi:hypothetical protein
MRLVGFPHYEHHTMGERMVQVGRSGGAFWRVVVEKKRELELRLRRKGATRGRHLLLLSWIPVIDHGG